MIVNLLLLRGNIGREGAGACPVRGHSNVQGDRTMMIWEKPPQAFLDRLQQVFGFDPPRKEGYDTIAAIEAMREGRARVFFGMGGNFAIATPDSHAHGRTAGDDDQVRALQTAHLSIQIMQRRRHARQRGYRTRPAAL